MEIKSDNPRENIQHGEIAVRLNTIWSQAGDNLRRDELVCLSNLFRQHNLIVPADLHQKICEHTMTHQMRM